MHRFPQLLLWHIFPLAVLTLFLDAGWVRAQQGSRPDEVRIIPSRCTTAKIDIETNRGAQGLELLRKVTATYANVPATWFYQGLGEFDAGNTDAALTALEKARGMHPEPELAPRIEYELSRVYRKLGRAEDANHAVQEYTRMREPNAKLNPAVLSAISSGFGSVEVPVVAPNNKN